MIHEFAIAVSSSLLQLDRVGEGTVEPPSQVTTFLPFLLLFGMVALAAYVLLGVRKWARKVSDELARSNRIQDRVESLERRVDELSAKHSAP